MLTAVQVKTKEDEFHEIIDEVAASEQWCQPPDRKSLQACVIAGRCRREGQSVGRPRSVQVVLVRAPSRAAESESQLENNQGSCGLKRNEKETENLAQSV